MNKIRNLICTILCLILLCTNVVTAQDDLSTTVMHVYASHSISEDIIEKMDVLYEVMEIEGSVMDTLHFDVELDGNTSGYRYRIFQYRAVDKKIDQIA
ncbi:MAG: hypothetical protein IJI46_03740 [Erysipelotrichaceae bacterium]|nr:hypothetical protein [Erysipelotrichaceae bacterium]